jgi:hypothetical protein
MWSALIPLALAIAIASCIARSPLRQPQRVDLSSRLSTDDAINKNLASAVPLDSHVEHVHCTGVVGAESFVELPFVDPNALFTGTADGRLLRLPRSNLTALRHCRDIVTVLRVGEKLANPSDVPFDFDSECARVPPRHESRCGRLLGLRAHPANSHAILAIDASYGLLMIDVVAKTVRVLANHDPATPADRFLFSNDLVVLHSQSLYFTVSSSLWERPFVIYEVMEARCTGRLMHFDLETNSIRTVLRDLCAPNGLELTANDDALLMVETSRARILRYDLARGTAETFVELGGYADNIRRSHAYPGEFWVAYAAQLTPLTVRMADSPRFRQFATGLLSLATVARLLPQYGMLERRSLADGALRARYADVEHGAAAHMSEVHEVTVYEAETATPHVEFALVGSYRNEFLTIFKLTQE